MLIISHFAFSQDDSILQLFSGKWKMETNKAEIYEEWIVEDENELVGRSFEIDDGAEVVSEVLYLKKYGE